MELDSWWRTRTVGEAARRVTVFAEAGDFSLPILTDPASATVQRFTFPVSLPRRGLTVSLIVLGLGANDAEPFFVRAASGSRTEAGCAKLILHDDPPLKCGGAFP